MSKEIRQMIDKVKNFKQFVNERKECIKSEKETLLALRNLLGKETVWLTQKNAYGDRRKYAFGFSIDEVAKRYNATDKAPAGYSHQYDVDITSMLEDELRKNGFKVVDVIVGSWVHGWIHRVVTLPCSLFGYPTTTDIYSKEEV